MVCQVNAVTLSPIVSCVLSTRDKFYFGSFGPSWLNLSETVSMVTPWPLISTHASRVLFCLRWMFKQFGIRLFSTSLFSFSFNSCSSLFPWIPDANGYWIDPWSHKCTLRKVFPLFPIHSPTQRHSVSSQSTILNSSSKAASKSFKEDSQIF